MLSDKKLEDKNWNITCTYRNKNAGIVNKYVIVFLIHS